MNRNASIAIVGSGISGLALSIALRQKGFLNISIYEKDASFDSRRQGYGLTILQGKSALRSLGVL
jgi:salicylate hydroxylase